MPLNFYFQSNINIEKMATNIANQSLFQPCFNVYEFAWLFHLNSFSRLIQSCNIRFEIFWILNVKQHQGFECFYVERELTYTCKNYLMETKWGHVKNWTFITCREIFMSRNLPVKFSYFLICQHNWWFRTTITT